LNIQSIGLEKVIGSITKANKDSVFILDYHAINHSKHVVSVKYATPTRGNITRGKEYTRIIMSGSEYEVVQQINQEVTALKDKYHIIVNSHEKNE
jgi:hypothetical protein